MEQVSEVAEHPVAPFPEATFEELFEPYYRAVVCFFAKRGLAEDACLDLAQETYLRAFRSFGRYRGEVKPSSWLFIIAANLWRNRYRNISTLKRSGIEVSTDAASHLADDPRLASQRESPEQEALGSERVEALRRAVAELPPKMRRIVQARIYQGLQYNEIAEVFQVSLQTVRSTLSQAKDRLRRILAEHFAEISW
jgi:RNA polymerase sigma-70 factor (ECF subfamily)